jgi:hypothetical protein
MNTNELQYLTNQIRALGFPNRIAEEASQHAGANYPTFYVSYYTEIGEDQLMYDLCFSKKQQRYQLTEYELTLRNIPIPDLNIQGISTKELDKKLGVADDWYSKFLDPAFLIKLPKQEHAGAVRFISETNTDVYRLAEFKEGEEAARLLMFKYFPRGEYEKFFSGYAALQQLYERNQTFRMTGDVTLTAVDAYRCLKAEVKASLDNNNLSTIKSDVMNEKNFEYLKDQVKFTGFGEAMENELRDKIRKQSPEFQLYHNTKFGSDVATATLHFKKSEQSEMYFFNRYDLILKLENSPDMMKQTFYINKANNITLKEAYNLMSGRAVNKDLTNKENQLYNAWVQMDFKQTDKNGNYLLKHYHQNYGFDLAKELTKHPIKELGSEQEKARLIESLQKGNRQAVTFLKEGTELKMFIEANPRFKTINVYDNNLQRLHNKQEQSEKKEQGERNNTKQVSKNESQKQGAPDDGNAMLEAPNKRRKKQGNSIS